MKAFRKIVSGGQTGADRAALDWALSRDIPLGGWCPAGRKAEDGEIPARYPLQETPETGYLARTRANVTDSQATVIFSLTSQLSGGTLETRRIAAELGRPCLELSREENPKATDAAARLLDFLESQAISALNLAGPRRSEEPEIGAWVTAVLEAAFPAPPDT